MEAKISSIEGSAARAVFDMPSDAPTGFHSPAERITRGENRYDLLNHYGWGM
jgi:hypothetical protein